MRWSRPQDFHLTLHFLGNTPARIVPDLERELGACVHHLRPFELAVGGLGVFPDVDKPRVLWAGVQDRHGQLEALHAKTGRILSRYRLFKLPEIYVPHITLGRVSELKNWDGRRLAALQEDWKRIGPLSVEYGAVMKTIMTQSGSQHHELFKIRLGGG